MDADTTSKKDAHLTILDALAEKKAQILIGTQMIAKGLDFPDVTLVGVIAADTSLFSNNVNAAERTFQLISQVSGRAGRDKLKGKVIVQTYSPEHYAIVASAKHDYINFYEQEIKLRRESLFPPFTKFSRLVISHENELSAKNDAIILEEFLKKHLEGKLHLLQSIIMLEATPAPYQRIRGQYRYQVLVKYYKEIYEEELSELMLNAKNMIKNQSTCTLELNTNDII
jgi:primosomal protein N' (replication factor Y)